MAWPFVALGRVVIYDGAKPRSVKPDQPSRSVRGQNSVLPFEDLDGSIALDDVRASPGPYQGPLPHPRVYSRFSRAWIPHARISCSHIMCFN
jgi:hypothetical protein